MTVSEERGSAVEALRAYVDAARSGWPDLAVDMDEFQRYLAARLSDGALPAAAHAGDLLLAWACARGFPAAIAAFRRVYHGTIVRVLSRRGADADVADEATQVVYERLLVGPPQGAPKIGEYKGIGPLRSWVSTVAATTLLMARRTAQRRREDPESVVAALRQASPELLYMKERYKSEVGDAIVSALAGLDERQRTLLRLSLGEGMSVDQLGALYKVNRATAARWLASAREALVSGAREAIRARLGLSDSECDSVAALVRSELHVSIVRHLS